MRNLSPEEYQAALDEIDLRLATMVAEEATVWTFDQIRPRAEMYLEQAQTAVERGRARLLVNKIARFEDIKRRYDAVNNLRDQTDRRQDELARLSRQRAEGRTRRQSGRPLRRHRQTDPRCLAPAVGATALRTGRVQRPGAVLCQSRARCQSSALRRSRRRHHRACEVTFPSSKPIT